MPSAMSRPSDPVETTSMSALAGCSPRRITEPLPNCFSIWLSAALSAFLRLLSSMPFVPPSLFRLFHNRPASLPSNTSTTLKLSSDRFFMGGSVRAAVAQAETPPEGTVPWGLSPLAGRNNHDPQPFRLKGAVPSGERPVRQRLVARPFGMGNRIDEGQATGRFVPEGLERPEDEMIRWGPPARARERQVRPPRPRLASVAERLESRPEPLDGREGGRRDLGRHRDQDPGLRPVLDPLEADIDRRPGPLSGDVEQRHKRLAR